VFFGGSGEGILLLCVVLGVWERWLGCGGWGMGRK
jgi:hypothetical protein